MKRAAPFSLSLAALAFAAPAQGAPFAFAVGADAQIATTGFGRPRPSRFQLPRSSESVTTASFAGESLALGLSLEARAFGVVGVTARALYATHHVRSTFGVDAGSADLDFSEGELRVPLLLKGVLPLSPIWPYLELGPEFVLPGLTRARQSSALRTVASSEPGFWYSAALGVELRAPLRSVDVRVPIGLRLSLNPRAPSERITALPSDALVLDSTPSYRFGLEMGATLWF